MRDLRQAQVERVHISRAHLVTIHATARDLTRHLAASMNSEDAKERRAAHAELTAAIEDFQEWALNHLPEATAKIALRPLEQPGER